MAKDMELVGVGYAWEDLPVGKMYRSLSRTITEADLVNFVGTTGMVEVLFTNTRQNVAEGEIEGRLVPAALVYTFSEGLLIPAVQTMGIAFLQMSLEVIGPIFVGDTIHVICEVIESRPSKSRSDVGLLRTRNTVLNQEGATSMIYTPLRLLKRRVSNQSLE